MLVEQQADHTARSSAGPAPHPQKAWDTAASVLLAKNDGCERSPELPDLTLKTKCSCCGCREQVREARHLSAPTSAETMTQNNILQELANMGSNNLHWDSSQSLGADGQAGAHYPGTQLPSDPIIGESAAGGTSTGF